jgi:hypothetical protein
MKQFTFFFTLPQDIQALKLVIVNFSIGESKEKNQIIPKEAKVQEILTKRGIFVENIYRYNKKDPCR